MKMEKTGENNIQHNRDLAQLVWILELGCTHGNTAGLNDFTTRFRQYSVLATRRNQVSGHLVNCERTEKQCLAKHTSKYHDAQNPPDDQLVSPGTAPSLTAAH